MVSVKEEASYKNYGKCLSVSNGAMEILVTVDVGPRIIRCSLIGKENLMHEDLPRNTTQDVSSLFGEGKTWNIYGGHRLWLSPEKFPDTYYPDNDKVVYLPTASGVEFIPPKQEHTGIAHSVVITMDETEPKLKITHKITNTGKNSLTGAAWALTVCAEGGAVIVPQPKEQTGLLANRVLALWPYTDMQDKRLFWGTDYIALRQDPSVEAPIKYGIFNTAGKVAYLNHGQALVKEFTPMPDKPHVDYGMNCEVYACKYFTEAETISPIQTIKGGEAIIHEEAWTLYGDVSVGSFSNRSLAEVAKKIF